MEYRVIIGLEIHAELSTKSKMFCGCINEFGGEVNTQCCPVCLGMPGSLPSMNKTAVEYAIMAGLAFNCEINKVGRMDRKNYFYPDLVKGYQITQDETPICTKGYIEIINADDINKKIRIQRIHIEEDTGKSLHTDTGDTLIDYNRCGVPLIEIVSEPDLSTADEAYQFLDSLRSTLKHIGISDCKMEEGSLRCDVNINVVDEENGRKTQITEVKNLNSFRGAVKAVEFETKRHCSALQNNEETFKETRRWDESNGETIVMRQKIKADEYRYAPDGDLPYLNIDSEWIEEIRSKLPELPQERKNRFINDYGLSAYDAGIITASTDLAEFFEECLKLFDDEKLIINWLTGEVLRIIKEKDLDIKTIGLSAKEFITLLKYIKDGKINNNTGKKVLAEMIETKRSTKDIIEEGGLIQISDEAEINVIVLDVLKNNPQSIEDYFNGKDRAIGFLVGQVMKNSKGKANPKIVNELIIKGIQELKE